MVSIERADVSRSLTLLAGRCYGMGMGRATNHLPNRKPSEQERAHFKRLGELEETVPKFGSRRPRQLGEVIEDSQGIDRSGRRCPRPMTWPNIWPSARP